MNVYHKICRLLQLTLKASVLFATINTEVHTYLKTSTCDPLKYIHVINNIIRIVIFSCMGKSIRIQRINNEDMTMVERKP